jgi:hypothetical protein
VEEEEALRQWRSVKVMTDWFGDPLWVFNPYANNSAVPVDPASPDLGLSADLARDLSAWQNEWDVTLNHDDPASSGFSTDEAERSFDERGWELARRVRREVPADWDVTYFSLESHTEVDVEVT